MSDNESKQPSFPEVTFTKNGYQIRAEILKQAQDFLLQEYQYKWQGWEIGATKDEKTGEYVTTVGMPSFPGIDTVLNAAEKFYSFVNTNHRK
jgi:hypothetical protein